MEIDYRIVSSRFKIWKLVSNKLSKSDAYKLFVPAPKQLAHPLFSSYNWIFRIWRPVLLHHEP